MVPNYKKIEALRVIIHGGTLIEAGSAIGLGPSQSRLHITRICRSFSLPVNLKYIRSNPDKYLAKIEEFKDEPVIRLRNGLVDKLVNLLRLKEPAVLTPQYLSNLTASQLLNLGITDVAIVEIQQWLSHFKLSLKLKSPQNDADIKKVKHAIAILKVFQFDIEILKNQISQFIGKDP